MDVVASLFDFFQSPLFAGIAAGLLLISEALASVPSIQANSVYQLVVGSLRKVATKRAP